MPILAAGYIMIREAFEDTMLQIPNPVGEEGSRTLPVPKGTQVNEHPLWLTLTAHNRVFQCR